MHCMQAGEGCRDYPRLSGQPSSPLIRWFSDHFVNIEGFANHVYIFIKSYKRVVIKL